MTRLYEKLNTREQLQRKYERMYCSVFQHANEGSKFVANQIAALINEKQANNETCVLGLATGSSPIAVYN